MNVTLTLPDDLVKKCRKIAVERDTTLTGMVRDYLQEVAAGQVSPDEHQRHLEALRRSFKELSFKSDGRKWTREELNERPTKYVKAFEQRRKP